MNNQPIRINVPAYNGKEQAKKLRYQADREAANQIEEYLNANRGDAPTSFDYYTIAEELGLTKEKVKEILFRNGGGSNGITL